MAVILKRACEPLLVALLVLAGCSRETVQPTTSQAAPSLIPAPRELVRSNGEFTLDSRTRVTVTTPAAQSTADYFTNLVQRTHQLRLNSNAGAKQIEFRLDAREGVFEPESYTLSVTPDRVVISASDPRGLFCGAVTLWQLIPPRATHEAKIPALTIHDAPRFAWRGLLLDSARHYQSPQFIRLFLDAMALHKLNVLHWHLVDDQAWRLEIKQYPRLTTIGAWRVPAGAAENDIDLITNEPRLYGGFYSQDQVREIVAYAAERHITIVPEIEMPGHASAAIAAYPELGVMDAPNRMPLAQPPSDWGVYSNLFNVDDATFAFLENVLRETMTLFPGEYIHIGGDEAVKDLWRNSPRVQQRMRELGIADEHALQSWFIQRIGRFLSANGRRLIGWDEILEGGLAPDATVMSWRGIDGAVAAAAAGHDAVLSPAPMLYFDHRPYAAAVPGRGRVIGVEDVYRFDPAPSALTDAQRQHILGVQANLWTEHMRTEDRVEYMAFPRLAALAEVAWSAHREIDWQSFRDRLPTQLERYEMLDLHYAKPDEAQVSGTLLMSHALQLCSEDLVLSLEDDAPPRGARAVFLADIMNPCWIYRQADLSQGATLHASVGEVPFNFQIGADVKKIPLRSPSTPNGELTVHADTCDGETLATLPLAPATSTDAIATLPPVTLGARPGRHDLCLVFTRAKVDPMWLLNSVDIRPQPRP